MVVRFEWPAPYTQPCGKIAIDRKTKEIYRCMLGQQHFSENCHWRKIVGDQLISVTWIPTGPETYVGDGS